MGTQPRQRHAAAKAMARRQRHAAMAKVCMLLKPRQPQGHAAKAKVCSLGQGSPHKLAANAKVAP